MKTQITLKEAAGRTLTGAEITGTCSADGLLLSFEDGTFIFVRAVRGWGDSDSPPEIEEDMVDPLRLDSDTLVRLGMTTLVELTDLRRRDEERRRRDEERREASRREHAEAQDMRDYARLKAKFETGSA